MAITVRPSTSTPWASHMYVRDAAQAQSRTFSAANSQVLVRGGGLRGFDTDAWFNVDFDFDGEDGLLDVYGLELEFAVDPATLEPIPEEGAAPIWRYGYYDPDARPSIGYIFQIFGVDAFAYQIIDAIVASFEPPDGVPGIAETP